MNCRFPRYVNTANQINNPKNKSTVFSQIFTELNTSRMLEFLTDHKQVILLMFCKKSNI